MRLGLRAAMLVFMAGLAIAGLAAFVVVSDAIGTSGTPSSGSGHGGHESTGVAAAIARFGGEARGAPSVGREKLDDGSRHTLATPSGPLISAYSSATSRTYRTARGTMLTDSYLSPVNYQDSAGEWQPILNQLVRDKTGWRNEANSLLLNLPTTLSAPVSLSAGSASVSFALLGAHGTAAVSGDIARYANALPMADAAYESTSSGVDERITLKTSAAPRVLNFNLSTGPNLQLRRMAEGALGLFDDHDGLVFYIPQSVAYPATGTATPSRPLPLSLTGSGSNWRLSLNLEEPWLRRELSSGPVIVDPSITYGHHESGAGDGGPERTCTLKEASPTKSFCSKEENLSVGNKTGAVEHALIFPSSSHPGNAILLRGELVLSFAHSATKKRVNLGIYRVTQASTASATWDTYDGTHAWKTPGGDYGEGGDTLVVDGAGGEEAEGPEVDLNITQMMQEWENGPESKAAQGYAGDGMMLALAPGSEKNTIEFHNGTDKAKVPIYVEEWVGGGSGVKPQFTMLPIPLTDRMNMAVNAANGNLLVQSNDLSVKGRGIEFTANRVYNSETSSAFQNEFGTWQDSNQPGLRKESNGEGGSRNLLLFRDGTGAWYQFYWNASTSEYITPPGLKATLCASYSASPCPVSSTYRLTFNESQTHIDFNSYGAPVDVEDRHGNKLASNGENYPPTKWTDTEGRAFTYTKIDSEGTETEERARTNAYTSLTDVSGERTVHYGYETVERLPVLTSFTDAAGNITHYEYKGSKLIKVTSPRGEVTKITYTEAPATRTGLVEKIIRTTNAEHSEGPIWTFKYYKAGEAPAPCTSAQQATVVKDPDGSSGETGHTTTYCANAWDQVEKTVDASGNETATSYDAFGNVSAITAPARETGDSRGVTSFVYGTNGQNLLCEVQGTTSVVTECPAGALEKGYSTSQTYEDTNFAFQPTKTTSPRLQTTNLCYYGGTHACTGKGKEGETGEGGALRRETQPLEETTTIYTYEKDGNVSSSTDFDGHTTSYEYDASGNLKTVIPPSGSGLGEQTIAVDGDSRPHIIVQCLAESSCTSSDTTTLTYDPLDRVTEAVYTGPGATKTIKYTYDADGNLEKRVDPTGTTNFTLDPLNRLTEEALPGSVSNAYSYDEASNLLSLTDAGGTTHYFYNGLNELESMYEPGGNCGKEPSKCTTTVHDNDGSLTKTTYPSGASMRYKLDPTTGRILVAEADGTKGETLLSHTYSYYTSINDSPLIFKDTFSGPGGVTAESDYTYDALDRLLEGLTKARPRRTSPAIYTATTPSGT